MDKNISVGSHADHTLKSSTWIGALGGWPSRFSGGGDVSASVWFGVWFGVSAGASADVSSGVSAGRSVGISPGVSVALSAGRGDSELAVGSIVEIRTGTELMESDREIRLEGAVVEVTKWDL